uniref:ferredoxin reductase family protein n=1 Tax=Polynucleobacter sp. TaxID=2029855 RepID=UPI00404776EA
MVINVLSCISLLIYLSLILLPLCISMGLNLPNRPWPDELSSSLAMIGFNIILIEFWLSGRVKLLSKILGIDWVLQVHQLFARTALVFLLVHPFMYTLPSQPVWMMSASHQNFLGLTLASGLTGMLSLFALICLVGLAITRKSSEISYEAWRLSHVILALIVATIGFFHTIDAGRYAQELWVNVYWQLMLGLALLTVAWTYIVKPLIQSKNAYEVMSIKQVSMGIWELVLKHPAAKQMNYQAGQFAWLKIGSSSPMPENPFSIASCSKKNSSEISFLIKDVGDFTHQIGQLRIGQKMFVDGPYGNFGIEVFSNDQDQQVMIAGGVGIAPMISILRQMERDQDTSLMNKQILLIYGNRVVEQAVNLKDMVKLESFKNLEVVHLVSEPTSDWQGLTGVLDATTLERILSANQINPKTAQFLICGPAEMIDSVETSLDQFGAPLTNIASEKFQYDFGKKNPKNRRSAISAILGSTALLAAAIYAALH